MFLAIGMPFIAQIVLYRPKKPFYQQKLSSARVIWVARSHLEYISGIEQMCTHTASRHIRMHTILNADAQRFDGFDINM